MSLAPIRELGWQPDMPDWRDWTANHPKLTPLFSDLAPLGTRPKVVSWRDYCPRVLPESDVPSSTQVCVDLLQYFERRVNGQQVRLSYSFVNRTAARYSQAHAGNPLSLRQVWKTVVRFGVPTANVWPRPEQPQELEPDAFAYFMARSYSSLLYVRLDARVQTTNVTLETLRSFLAAGFLFVFGFPHFTSISPDGQIGFPTTYDLWRGGHAVLAVGYDDDYRLRSDRGCFQVRGQWGEDWGDEGYGWLPYSYVRKQLATDCWAVVHPQWLASGEFRRPLL